MIARNDADAMVRRAYERFGEQFGTMSPAQFAYRPAAQSWSVADVAEHVALSNAGILQRLSAGLRTPLSGPLGVEDEEIPYLFYAGEEPTHIAAPTGTWTDVAVAADAYAASARAVTSWAEETNVDLRLYGGRHPMFGLLDGVQWLLFAAAHTERHRRQILGYSVRPDFPGLDV